MISIRKNCSGVLALLALGMALAPPEASAAEYSCGGKVQQVAIDINGNVNVSFDFGAQGGMAWMSVCGLAEPMKGVATAACKGVYANLLSARLADRTVMMWFNNESQSCTAPAWGYLKDLGWYWGPSIQ